jgi:hypothetical protein
MVVDALTFAAQVQTRLFGRVVRLLISCPHAPKNGLGGEASLLTEYIREPGAQRSAKLSLLPQVTEEAVFLWLWFSKDAPFLFRILESGFGRTDPAEIGWNGLALATSGHNGLSKGSCLALHQTKGPFSRDFPVGAPGIEPGTSRV